MIEIDERYKQFTNLITNISRSISKIKKIEMANFGLKGKQVQCLFVLHNQEKGATVSELAEMCGEDKASISRTIHELEDQDYLYLDTNEKQKYKNHVRLTEKGAKMAKIVFERVSDFASKVGMGTTDSERRAMYRTLTRYSHNLDKAIEEAGE